jgi:Transcription factor WhiB
MAFPPAILRANRPDPTHREPAPDADQSPWALLTRHARCVDAGLDPDHWFPVSAEEGKARQEAAEAIAICDSCLVRSLCLGLSLRYWDIGQHGVWGGLVATERARLRRRITPDHNGCGGAPAQATVVESERCR